MSSDGELLSDAEKLAQCLVILKAMHDGHPTDVAIPMWITELMLANRKCVKCGEDVTYWTSPCAEPGCPEEGVGGRV